MEEFSKPQYGVDVLKVEVPVNMAFVKGTQACKGESAYTRDEAKDHFRQAAAVAKKPFIYLSAGVSNERFNETLELAAEAGMNFSGVLCGRATWKDGIPVYAKQGMKALEDWLADQGVKNIKNVNARLTAAKPWFGFYGASSAAARAEAAIGTQRPKDSPWRWPLLEAANAIREALCGRECTQPPGSWMGLNAAREQSTVQTRAPHAALRT